MLANTDARLHDMCHINVRKICFDSVNNKKL